MINDPMKKSSIYSIFGKYYGNKLYKLLDECCDGNGNFCYEVKECLGISDTGNPSLVLNQQGNWVAVSSGAVYTFNDTNSVDLTLTGTIVTADIKLDPNPLNIISITPSGLLVLPTSTEQTVEFLDLNSGNTVSLPSLPTSVKVFRNGIRLNSTEYSVSGLVITFTDAFGLSGGATGAEDIIVDYYS